MTKAELETRNAELVRIADKEFERAERLAFLIGLVHEAIDCSDWVKIPFEIRLEIQGHIPDSLKS